MNKLYVHLINFCLFSLALTISEQTLASTEQKNSIADQLGWVNNTENQCGGYYLDEAFIYPIKADTKDTVEITSKQSLYSQRGTTLLEGNVSINRFGQQITCNKAFIYRDTNTSKLSSIKMIGDVHLREPNTLIIAKQGRYFFDTKIKTLADILYRTSLMDGKQVAGPRIPAIDVERTRKIRALTAWGKADQFTQNQPLTYELDTASYSTCPPNTTPAWQVRASHILLNKEDGRGYATHARLHVKSVPIFYLPYINFPIDDRRKTGFLWPTIGLASNEWGPYLKLPFYWNMAPNYDLSITPAILTKRGVQVANDFRYLSSTSSGSFNFTILPNDVFFRDFQNSAAANTVYTQSSSSFTQANLNRLLDSSTTRKGFYWRDTSIFSQYWSSKVDFNYASDDYYMRNFGNLNQLTENQLLQEAFVSYKGRNWDFLGRVQGYQTLHPLSESNQVFENQYRRLPQLVLNGEYPDRFLGLTYFIYNEASNFDILKTPGGTLKPMGNRLHTQPGISWPYYLPYFYMTPRAQLALTNYDLNQTTDTQTPNNIQRGLPIFDVAAGMAVVRSSTLFGYAFRQTLEPQIYYTYIPYRNQSSIPTFDTTENTLTYDQLFNYNRFSGLDRIGDANQMSVGVTSRIIDQQSGLEKVRLSLGEIIYFANRLVTLCTGNTCASQPVSHSNQQRLSPLSGMLDYHINPTWNFRIEPVIWNPVSKQLNNSTFTFQYRPDIRRIINFSYTYAHGGDTASGIVSNNPSDNLKVTTLSGAWPATENVSLVGRWSQNWNHAHLQDLLYGLEYDTCCWAVRMVGGRAYAGLAEDKYFQPQYKNEFYVQFSLKGLGDIGSGDPTALLSNVTGYNTGFGHSK